MFRLPLHQVDAFRRDLALFKSKKCEHAESSLGSHLDMEKQQPSASMVQSFSYFVDSTLSSSSSSQPLLTGVEKELVPDLTEDQLWFQETQGAGEGTSGTFSGLPVSFHHNPRLNQLRCSFDSG